MTDIEKVLSYLKDEESRYIYQKLLEFKQTSNHAAMRAVIDRYVPALKGTYHYTGIENEIIELIRSKKESVVIFGAGFFGGKVLALLSDAGIFVEAVLDNDESKWGNEISEKVTVKSPGTIDYNNPCTFVISPCDHGVAAGIYNQLKGYGVADNRIVCYRNYCFTMTEKEQYFDRNIMRFESREVFIDGGALNLYTSRRFVEECAWRGTKEYKIIAFEPDHTSYKRCQDRLKEMPDSNIELHNAGMWSCNTTLHFSGDGNGDSRIVQEDTGTSCKVVSLDDFLTDGATFIKMDIEGAELEALKGSERMIKRYKPKLAVCIYHKKSDLTDIPLFIKSLVPEYRLYIRHYSNSMCETVLYAVL